MYEPKITIIGSGLVGSQTALLLLIQNITDTIYIYDKNHNKAVGESMDINQCMSVLNNEKNCIPVDEIPKSDIIIVAVGRRRNPGEIRTDLYNENLIEIIDVARHIRLESSKAIILMVTNPSDDLSVDMAYYTSCKVYPIGTKLDTARLRELIHSKHNLPRNDIHAFVTGEHGENMIMHDAYGVTPKECKDIAINTIIAKGSTVYAPAMVVVNKIKEIIEQNQ